MDDEKRYTFEVEADKMEASLENEIQSRAIDHSHRS